MDKTKIEISKDVANMLIKRKEVGQTYSDVIRKLIENDNKKRNQVV